MFRYIARLIGILAVLVPLAASALDVPKGVNLHNGYIEVINHVQYRDGFSAAGLVNLNKKPEGEVGANGTLVVNRCCILAGSEYNVELNYVQSASLRTSIDITPRLCNIRGIPFGYAVIEFTGTIVKTREGSGNFTRYEMTSFSEKRLDEACPTER